MAKRGRPREFDRDEALRRAMEVFWRLGYEGASLSALKAAMGDITSPSFYAAFGCKEALFREAVALYRAEGAVFPALEKGMTARAGVEAMLREAAASFSLPDKPRGCFIVLGAMNCAPESREVQEHLAALRQQTPDLIRRRIERGIADGDVPGGIDAAALASFYTTVLHGLSIQARDGAPYAALMAAIDCAMAAWDGLIGRPDKAGRKNGE